MKLVRRWWDDRGGATIVEYGVVVGVLSLVIISSLGTVYNSIQVLFEDNNNRLVQAVK